MKLMGTTKENNPELILQEIENLLLKHNTSIIAGKEGELFIKVGKQKYKLYDIESNNTTNTLPRWLIAERLVIEK